MSSKQTDESQEKKQPLTDSQPDPASKNPKPVKKTKDETMAEFEKMWAEEMGKSRPVANKQEDIVSSGNTIQTKLISKVMDSLQTESAVQADIATQTVLKRTSSKQRKESLEEYRETFLTVPKLEDRKPVFVSREVRDQLDEIARKLGGRRMSVSGFIENLARHHLEMYKEDVEGWKKL